MVQTLWLELQKGGEIMVPGLELVAGYLTAWAARKAHRVGARLDAEADLVIDVELDKLHDLVAAKLGADPALGKLELAAVADNAVSDRTCRRVTDALEEAVDDDPEFAVQVVAALSALERIIPPAVILATGERSAVAGRDVNITAEGGSAAAQVMGDVTVGSPPLDPSVPGRHGS